MVALTFWRLAGALLLAVALLGGIVALPNGAATAGLRTAEAAVAADRQNADDDDDDESDNDDDNDDDDQDEERELDGQVVSPSAGVPGVNRGAAPPEIYVATLDGVVKVVITRPAALDESGVQEGDHVRVDGERVYELLFMGSHIDVKDHCCGDIREGDDDHVYDPSPATSDEEDD